MPMDGLVGANATESSGDGPSEDIILADIALVAPDCHRREVLDDLVEDWLGSKTPGKLLGFIFIQLQATKSLMIASCTDEVSNQ